jgi:TPR repeat protein
MNNLGAMYEKGAGVAKDAAEAVRWYRKAADAGNQTANRSAILQDWRPTESEILRSAIRGRPRRVDG